VALDDPGDLAPGVALKVHGQHVAADCPAFDPARPFGDPLVGHYRDHAAPSERTRLTLLAALSPSIARDADASTPLHRARLGSRTDGWARQAIGALACWILRG
jgi:hypothetical protein